MVEDADKEDASQIVIQIFRIFKDKLTLVHEGKPTSRNILRSNSVYIIQSDREFWVWTGTLLIIICLI